MPYNRGRRHNVSESLGTAPAKLNTNRLAANQPSAVQADEILDWDCALEAPPPAQRSGRIEVTLRKAETGPSAA